VADSTLIFLSGVCTVCTKERERTITSRGITHTGWRYKDPPGYKTKGDERRSIQQWRTTLVVNLFGDSEAQQPRRAARKRAS
jgi:hypothetical protein